jgi:hypothetical protein
VGAFLPVSHCLSQDEFQNVSANQIVAHGLAASPRKLLNLHTQKKVGTTQFLFEKII